MWGILCGAIMLSGYAGRVGDVPLMLLGVGTAAVAVIGPLLTAPAECRAQPLLERAELKMGVSIIAFSFFWNWSQTPFFFDVLHMHFGFQTQLNLRSNPVFLYFLTVTYFSTYVVLLTAGWRASAHLLRGLPRAGRLALQAPLPFAVAFLETLLNANPFIRDVFCYDDLGFALSFGTLAYGTSFCFALPVWLHIDETPKQRVSLFTVLLWAAAATYAAMLMLDLYRYALAPHFTDVVEGAQGLRDYAGSCLAPPTQGAPP